MYNGKIAQGVHIKKCRHLTTHMSAHTHQHTPAHTHTLGEGGSSLKRDGQTGFWLQIATLEQLLSKRKRHRPQTRTRTSTWAEREGYRERE